MLAKKYITFCKLSEHFVKKYVERCNLQQKFVKNDAKCGKMCRNGSQTAHMADLGPSSSPLLCGSSPPLPHVRMAHIFRMDIVMSHKEVHQLKL